MRSGGRPTGGPDWGSAALRGCNYNWRAKTGPAPTIRRPLMCASALEFTVVRQVALRIQGRHATTRRGRDGLAVIVVGHVAGREYAFDARVGALRCRQLDVAAGL